MDKYFNHLVSNLTIDDMMVLGFLSDNQVDTLYKAKSKFTIQLETGLSSTNFKKSLFRLEVIKFIKVDKSTRRTKVYISDYGLKAVQLQIAKEENKC